MPEWLMITLCFVGVSAFYAWLLFGNHDHKYWP